MKYLYGYDQEGMTHLINDWPWVFRLKCQIKWWVESKKGKGQRLCSQTLNPKTNKWCKPKKSTYSLCVILAIDEEGKIASDRIGKYDSNERIEKFITTHGESLSEFQRSTLSVNEAFNKLMEKVTWKIGSSDSIKEKKECDNCSTFLDTQEKYDADGFTCPDCTGFKRKV